MLRSATGVLKRAWRYENAASLAARRDFVRAELREQEKYCKERGKEEEAVILRVARREKGDGRYRRSLARAQAADICDDAGV